MLNLGGPLHTNEACTHHQHGGTLVIQALQEVEPRHKLHFIAWSLLVAASTCLELMTKLTILWISFEKYVICKYHQCIINKVSTKVGAFNPLPKTYVVFFFWIIFPNFRGINQKKGLKKSTTVADRLSLIAKPSKQLFKDMSSTTLQVTLVQVRPGTSDG